MSKCIFKEIADSLNKELLDEYYQYHLTSEVCEHFEFDKKYFYRIFHYLEIDLRTSSANKILREQNMSDEEKRQRNELLVSYSYNRVFTDEVRNKISNSNKGKIAKANITSFKKGAVPWNKGKHGLQTRSKDTIKKYNETMQNKKWFAHKTKAEIDVECVLVNKYGRDDVVYLYRDEERYLFNCDFYIKSIDLFIEVNAHWTHGPHPFDENNPEDIDLLDKWKEKAKTSKFYENAINTWTVRDVEKLKYAKENKLNYISLYDIKSILNSLAI